VATRAHAHPAAPARERAAPRSEGRQPGLPSLVIICVMVIGLAGLLPLLVSSKVVHTSEDIRQLEGARDDWEARTQELEAEIATLGSLDRIEKEARQRLGMVPPEETIYITVDQPAPEKQIVPQRFLPPKKEQSQQEDSWWESILGMFHLP
jgi:cell division protein FtsL